MASEKDDLGLGPGVSFTFGDIAIFDALNQIVDAFGLEVLAPFRELKVCLNAPPLTLAEVLRPVHHPPPSPHVHRPSQAPPPLSATPVLCAFIFFVFH